MWEYVYILVFDIGFFYLYAYYCEEIKKDVIFINIESPFRRLLVPSGKATCFTISGVIAE